MERIAVLVVLGIVGCAPTEPYCVSGEYGERAVCPNGPSEFSGPAPNCYPLPERLISVYYNELGHCVMDPPVTGARCEGGSIVCPDGYEPRCPETDPCMD